MKKITLVGLAFFVALGICLLLAFLGLREEPVVPVTQKTTPVVVIATTEPVAKISKEDRGPVKLTQRFSGVQFEEAKQ